MEPTYLLYYYCKGNLSFLWEKKVEFFYHFRFKLTLFCKVNIYSFLKISLYLANMKQKAWKAIKK